MEVPRLKLLDTISVGWQSMELYHTAMRDSLASELHLSFNSSEMMTDALLHNLCNNFPSQRPVTTVRVRRSVEGLTMLASVKETSKGLTSFTLNLMACNVSNLQALGAAVAAYFESGTSC